MKTSAIIVCAGSASRSKLNKNKVLFDLGGKTVLEKLLETFSHVSTISQIVVAAAEKDMDEISQICSNYPPAVVVLGGKSRTESVKNALPKITGDIVLIHDGARPFATTVLIERAIDGAIKFGSAIAAIPSTDTLAKVNGDIIEQTVRDGYYQIQTPQAFCSKKIKDAYSQISDNEIFSDDSAVFAKFIEPCHLIEGERQNIKLTYPEDFSPRVRVGTGFDLHQLVEGRKLILGGIEITHSKGLLGHSDADVLTHAIMDSLLSACSLRDIGYHFPDTDPQYLGISSVILLKKVLELVHNEGYEISNISACIMAEKPKLKGYIPTITQNLADIIGIPAADIGIGCTTLEGLGIVGREEGIAVSANCSLKKHY